MMNKTIKIIATATAALMMTRSQGSTVFRRSSVCAWCNGICKTAAPDRERLRLSKKYYFFDNGDCGLTAAHEPSA